MPEAERLRDYFDSVVERVDVDDVMVQLSIRHEAPRHRRPTLAVAGAFIATILAVGGVLALAVLAPLEGEGTDAATNEFRWVIEAPAAVGPVVAIVLAAAGAAVVTGVVLLAAIPVLARRRQRRETGMKTVEREMDVVGSDEVRSLENQRRWLIVLVAFLVVTTVGFGAWAINSAGDEDLTVVALQGELTEHQQAMLDFIDGEWKATWDSGDGEAIAELFVPTGYHMAPGGAVYRNADGSLAEYLGMVAVPGSEGIHHVVYENFVFEIVTNPEGFASTTFVAAVFELTLSEPIRVVSLIGEY